MRKRGSSGGRGKRDDVVRVDIVGSGWGEVFCAGHSGKVQIISGEEPE